MVRLRSGTSHRAGNTHEDTRLAVLGKRRGGCAGFRLTTGLHVVEFVCWVRSSPIRQQEGRDKAGKKGRTGVSTGPRQPRVATPSIGGNMLRKAQARAIVVGIMVLVFLMFAAVEAYPFPPSQQVGDCGQFNDMS